MVFIDPFLSKKFLIESIVDCLILVSKGSSMVYRSSILSTQLQYDLQYVSWMLL